MSPCKSVLPALWCRQKGMVRWRAQGFLASRRLCGIRQPLVSGSWSRPFLQTIPTGCFRAMTVCSFPALASSSPPVSWEHCCDCSVSPFELNNRSDVNCRLNIKIVGTCFSHAGLGWAGARLPPHASPRADQIQSGLVTSVFFPPPVTGRAAPATGKNVAELLAGLLSGLLQD